MITARTAVLVFAAFAFTYFLSALLRAVTATLAPQFAVELQLTAADLGLLAGAYFAGFALLQLPLGRALDRFGPRRSLLALLVLAVMGCMAFAVATSLVELIAARMLIGAGVAACLMAPLTLYRQLFSPAAQLRANSWMLMTGSLGMLASTLPVQWLLPVLGWRGLFVALALALAVGMVLILRAVPPDRTCSPGPPEARVGLPAGGRYRDIMRQRSFRAMAPLAFFLYGGMIAVQALWAGPWLTQVVGLGAGEAAAGLFLVNLGMLITFACWGLLMPRLVARGWSAEWLMLRGVPLALLLLVVNAALGAGAGPWHWAFWCMSCTVVSLSQPAVGAAFPAAQAGRALSAFNLVIFSGVFAVQWGLGLVIDALRTLGLAEVEAFRMAFGALALACGVSYAWFVHQRCGTAHNGRQDPP
jgi:MFS family permease